MEDLRQAAKAYFYHAPAEVKQQAYDLFGEMDTDGDGEISSSEFKEYVQQAGYNMIQPNFFHELDHDGNGRLDFWEFVTFFYVVTTRTTLCCHCKAYLIKLYFTCVECFERANYSYDLCLSCYGKRQFQHQHTVFLDNYVMIMRKPPLFAANRFSSSTAQPQPQPQPQPKPQPQPSQTDHLALATQTHHLALATQTRHLAFATHSKRHKLKTAFELLHMGISTWAAAASLDCSIM